MNKHPLSTVMEHDPALFKTLSDAQSLGLGPGALAPKYKLLIAMALDASHGTAEGARALAQQAMAAGATKDEVLEAVRVVYHICGAGSVYTASRGLDGLFDKTI